MKGRRAKTNVNTTANQKKGKYFKRQWELKVKPIKLPIARENKSDQVVIDFSLHVIGWESGASFLDQSQSKAKKNNAVSDYFQHLNQNCSNKSWLVLVLHLGF